MTRIREAVRKQPQHDQGDAQNGISFLDPWSVAELCGIVVVLHHHAEYPFCAVSGEPARTEESRLSMDHAIHIFAHHLAELRRSPLTIRRYRQVLLELKSFLANTPAFSGKTLNDLTEEDARCFLCLDGERQGAASTQNVRLSALRAFCGFLVRQGLVATNPVLGLRSVPVHAREPVFLTMREYKRLLRLVRRRTLPSLLTRNEAIVVILFNTGLRVSELASLTLDKLDFDSKAFRNVPLKGGRFGSIEWNRETERVLLSWLETRKIWAVPEQCSAVFVTEKGRPLSVRAIQEMFGRYSRLLCLGKRLTPHVLRHSMATELLRQGNDIRVIASILHHASLNSTKRYAHVVDSLRRQALSSLEPEQRKTRRSPARDSC